MSKILQFKITLKWSNPKIWRRIQVEDSMMFYDLHLIIQNVLGWENCHLYQFKFDRKSFIGNPELFGRDDTADDNEIELSAIFDKPKIKMEYEYDFGDSWIHEIVLEKILEKDAKQFYPFCLAGERNCPPEDCGGIFSFYDKMDAIKNKDHPEHEDIVEWMGDEFDTENFNLKEINNNLKHYTQK